MIRIYAMKTIGMTRAELLPRIRLDIGDTKRAAWERMPEEKAVGSLAGVLLLQYALEQAEICADGLSMEYGLYGRPQLPIPQMDFNISHTDGLTLCAVEFGSGEETPRVSIDAERVSGRTRKSMERITAGWFTKKEKEVFLQSPTEDVFLKIWTGKEALSKWSGDGLSMLSRCDTIQPPTDRVLTVYTIQDVTVTLCHRANATAPDHISFPFNKSFY